MQAAEPAKRPDQRLGQTYRFTDPDMDLFFVAALGWGPAGGLDIGQVFHIASNIRMATALPGSRLSPPTAIHRTNRRTRGISAAGRAPPAKRYDIACGAFAFTLIPTLAATGEPSISLLAARAWETLIGGLLGLVAAMLLFPIRAPQTEAQ